MPDSGRVNVADWEALVETQRRQEAQIRVIASGHAQLASQMAEVVVSLRHHDELFRQSRDDSRAILDGLQDLKTTVVQHVTASQERHTALDARVTATAEAVESWTATKHTAAGIKWVLGLVGVVAATAAAAWGLFKGGGTPPGIGPQ